MALRYELRGYPEDSEDNADIDYSLLKGRSQRIKDIVSGLTDDSTRMDNPGPKQVRAMRQLIDEAVFIANEMVNKADYWGRNG